jgi:hypothetical protein
LKRKHLGQPVDANEWNGVRRVKRLIKDSEI